jgi:hypothetical protein
MRKTISQQMSFGDGFIDSSLYELDEELKKADELLSNVQLLKPFEEIFDEDLGRPGTPVGILADDVSEISLGVELRRGREGSERETSVAVFLSPFLDGWSSRRYHLDQAQPEIWRRSGQRAQQASDEAVVEEPID